MLQALRCPHLVVAIVLNSGLALVYADVEFWSTSHPKTRFFRTIVCSLGAYVTWKPGRAMPDERSDLTSALVGVKSPLP